MISSAIDSVSSIFGLVTPVDWVMFIGIGLLVNFVTALVMHRLINACMEEHCIERVGTSGATYEDCDLVWRSGVPFYVKVLIFAFWPWSVFLRWATGKWKIYPLALDIILMDYSVSMAILMPVKILFNLVSYPIILVLWFIYMTIIITR